MKILKRIFKWTTLTVFVLSLLIIGLFIIIGLTTDEIMMYGIATFSGMLISLPSFLIYLFLSKSLKNSSSELEQSNNEVLAETEDSSQVTKAEPRYSLAGIAIASRLTEKGYNTILSKIPQIELDLEKNDPFDLPTNVSDERYDRVSDKYDWLTERLERNTDAVSIFEKIGHKKGGHGLTRFPEVEVNFDYSKPEGTSNRTCVLRGYNFADFNLYIVCDDNGVEKTFTPYKMSNLKIGENKASASPLEIIQNIANDYLEAYIETLRIKSDEAVVTNVRN